MQNMADSEKGKGTRQVRKEVFFEHLTGEHARDGVFIQYFRPVAMLRAAQSAW
jgi:hypothetical protein